MRCAVYKIALLCALTILTVHVCVTAVLKQSLIIRGPVALDNQAQFSLKLDAFRNNSGVNIAVLGDSLVLGRTLYDISPFEWREHSLDKALTECVDQHSTDAETVSVWNFGLNGAVPADFLKLAPELTQSGLVAVNINNRSFSADFNSADTLNSRDWISELEHSSSSEGNWQVQLQSWLQGLELSKRVIFDEDFKAVVSRNLKAVYGFFGFEHIAEAENPALLLKLKGRYQTISFDPQQSKQAEAFSNLLNNQRVLAFETAENPKLIRRVSRKSVREKRREDLFTLVNQSGGIDRFVPRPELLESKDFTDLVHVNKTGYKYYADAMCRTLVKLVKVSF